MNIKYALPALIIGSILAGCSTAPEKEKPEKEEKPKAEKKEDTKPKPKYIPLKPHHIDSAAKEQ